MNTFNADRLKEIILRAMQIFSTPAVSVTVIKNGEIVFSEGFGTRTLGKDEPVDDQTSYAIASMSKSTVSASLAMLHEQKAFDWEDPVSKYLPEFRLYDDFASKEIRVLDLLIHNCGLRSESAGTLWYGSDYSREEIIRRLRFLRPVSSFRSKQAYQNVCFLAAGLVIQAITGQTWDDFVAQNLFIPLNMTRTFPNIASLQSSGIGNIATPHAMIDGKLSIIPYRDHDNVGPAASVHSTARDLSQYLLMFLNHGSFENRKILSPESIDFLHEPHMLYNQSREETMIHPRMRATFPTFGLGWRVQDYCGMKSVGHSGGVDGMRGRMEMLPEINSAVVVLSNSEDRRTYYSTLYTALDMLAGFEPIDWIEAWKNDTEFHKQLPVPEKIPNTSPSLTLDQYAGIYQDSAYGELSVKQENCRLVLRFSHTPAFTADLEHWHYDTFKIIWRDPYIPKGLVTFLLGSDGKVNAFHLDQPRLLDVDFSELDDAIRKIS